MFELRKTFDKMFIFGKEYIKGSQQQCLMEHCLVSKLSKLKSFWYNKMYTWMGGGGGVGLPYKKGRDAC